MARSARPESSGVTGNQNLVDHKNRESERTRARIQLLDLDQHCDSCNQAQPPVSTRHDRKRRVERDNQRECGHAGEHIQSWIA